MTRPPMTRIGRLFEDLKKANRKGLIAYLTVGDPSPDRTPALVEALVRGGADMIELGVPFSDPIADGPVIQAAGERALKAGTTLARVLQVAAEIRRTSEVPLLLFTYLNPVVRYGLARLAQDAAAAGIDGCLLTDASVEEAQESVGAMHRHGLDTVFLAAPTSTERRLKLVAQYSTGFVYLVSRTGVTGERESLSNAVAPLVAAVIDSAHFEEVAGTVAGDDTVLVVASEVSGGASVARRLAGVAGIDPGWDDGEDRQAHRGQRTADRTDRGRGQAGVQADPPTGSRPARRSRTSKPSTKRS